MTGKTAIAQPISMRGKFKVEHYRQNQHIGTYDLNNDIVNAGKNSILGVQFHADTQITAWYIGLVDNSGFTAFSNSDTMSSHAGWNEFTTYSETNRVAWTPDAAASQSITNATARTFTISGSGTLKGIFVTSNNTKSGTSGTLWSTAAFAALVTVASSDQLKVTYTVNT